MIIAEVEMLFHNFDWGCLIDFFEYFIFPFFGGNLEECPIF
jgi:hypothetical protein